MANKLTEKARSLPPFGLYSNVRIDHEKMNTIYISWSFLQRKPLGGGVVKGNMELLWNSPA